jgi:PIN domain nuclease of toxin-antitoxin system
MRQVMAQRILLDSNVLIWWAEGNPRIGPRLRVQIENRPLAFASLASAWEIAIKSSIGRLRLPLGFDEFLDRFGFELLPIRLDHIREIETLPFHHRDPFDRMLVAQARIEGLQIITRDRHLEVYDVGVYRI